MKNNSSRWSERVDILLFLLLPRIPYFWRSTREMDWYKRRWSKYREWKICCSLFALSLKTLNLEISRSHRLGRLRQRIELKCVPHVQHDYFSSFNQSDPLCQKIALKSAPHVQRNYFSLFSQSRCRFFEWKILDRAEKLCLPCAICLLFGGTGIWNLENSVSPGTKPKWKRTTLIIIYGWRATGNDSMQSLITIFLSFLSLPAPKDHYLADWHPVGH